MVKSPSLVKEITLRVSESTGKDVGRGIARIDPADMQQLGVDVGDMLEVEGKRQTVCRVLPTFKEHRGKGHLQVDGVVRENARAGLNEMAVVRPASVKPAEELVLVPQGGTPSNRDLKYIGGLLDGLPVTGGDRVRVTLFGNRRADFLVKSTRPAGAVTVMSDTLLKVQSGDGQSPAAAAPLSYEDIGGLKRQLDRVREIVELPLKYPELFDRLGIDAPKGILLYGPPGCGKTLLARAVAHETEANFFSINGPEIIHKFYGESEAHLRKLFDEAAQPAPSIIFLDEIDAIAPRRERVVGDVEKRVVAQLLALMDGLSQRQHVIVLAATNLPNALDPALRRPGRFDREITIPIPDQHGRQEILEIHSRGMPLAEDVDLAHVAAITHGFVGADLEALCREAGMITLRRLLPQIDFSQPYVPDEMLAQLQVKVGDFQEALQEVEPSAVREVFVEVPNVTWNDVGGLDEIKQRLREAVEWPLQYPDLFESVRLTPPKGALVYGPPGCGKTLIAKALATEAGVNFVSVKGPELLSMYVGRVGTRAPRRVPQGAAGGALHHLLRRNRRLGLRALPRRKRFGRGGARPQPASHRVGRHRRTEGGLRAGRHQSPRPARSGAVAARPVRHPVGDSPCPTAPRGKRSFRFISAIGRWRRERRPHGWRTRPKDSAAPRSRESAAAR